MDRSYNRIVIESKSNHNINKYNESTKELFMPTVISGTTLNALTTVSWGVMSLFANNEQGVWFDPSDLNNYMSGLGPELVTNGDFSSGTGWTIGSGWSISGGTLNYSGAYNTSYFTAASNAFVAGRYYKVTLTISGNTSGNVNVYLNVPNNAVLNPVNISGNGEKTFFLLAGATCNGLHFVGNSATGAMSIDNISVKELTTISSATMFQDAAGTTPVTAVEQPVGLLLDKSKGLVLGSELVTNGTVATDSGWTKGTGWTISGGAALHTGGFGILVQDFSVTSGQLYKISYDLIVTSGSVNVRLGGSYTPPSRASSGSYTQYQFADAGTGIAVYGTFEGSIDNITVKALLGNHASQATDASRPVLSARVNLLTYTEQFDNAAWTKTNVTVPATQYTAPDGTTTADLIYPTTSGTSRYVERNTLGQTTGASFTTLIRLKNAGINFAYVYNVQGNSLLYVNLTTGVTSNVGTNISNLSSTIDANGWVTVSFTSTLTIGGTATWYVGPCDASGSTQVTANGTNGIYIWGADLRVANVGVNLPPYQRVGAAVTGTTNPTVTGVPDYDTAGFPLYLKFDGVDDSLSTNAFSISNPITSFAGVRFISGIGYVTDSVSGTRLYNLADGSTRQFGISAGLVTAAITVANITNVDTAAYNGASSFYRRNGALIQTGNTGSGTISTGLAIGRSQFNNAHLNGHLYSLIVRGALSDSVDITNTEAYINSKTKAY